MPPDITPPHAALILEAATGVNSLNSAVRALRAYETKDKKLAAHLTELLKCSERSLPRLVGQLDSAGVDLLNTLSNTTAAIGRALTGCTGPQIAAVLAHAERLASGPDTPTPPAA